MAAKAWKGSLLHLWRRFEGFRGRNLKILDLREEVYMDQPPGFVAHREIRKVCCPHKSLYGLQQSPHAWFSKLNQAVETFGMQKSNSYHSGFLKKF